MKSEAPSDRAVEVGYAQRGGVPHLACWVIWVVQRSFWMALRKVLDFGCGDGRYLRHAWKLLEHLEVLDLLRCYSMTFHDFASAFSPNCSILVPFYQWLVPFGSSWDQAVLAKCGGLLEPQMATPKLWDETFFNF